MSSNCACGIFSQVVRYTVIIYAVLNGKVRFPVRIIKTVALWNLITLRSRYSDAFIVLNAVIPGLCFVLWAVKPCLNIIYGIGLNNELGGWRLNYKCIVVICGDTALKFDIVRCACRFNGICTDFLTRIAYELTVKNDALTCQRSRNVCPVSSIAYREFRYLTCSSAVVSDRLINRFNGNNSLINCKCGRFCNLCYTGNSLDCYSVSVTTLGNCRFSKCNWVRLSICFNRTTELFPLITATDTFLPLIRRDAWIRFSINSKCCIFAVCYGYACRICNYKTVIVFTFDLNRLSWSVVCLICRSNYNLVFTNRNIIITDCEVSVSIRRSRLLGTVNAVISISYLIERRCCIKNIDCDGNLGLCSPYTFREARCSSDYRSNMVICHTFRWEICYIAGIIGNAYINNLLTVRIADNEGVVACNVVIPVSLCGNCRVIELSITDKVTNFCDITVVICISQCYCLGRIEENVERINSINKCRPRIVSFKCNRTGRLSFIYLYCCCILCLRLKQSSGHCLKLVRRSKSSIVSSGYSYWSLLILVTVNLSPFTAVNGVPECGLTLCRRIVCDGYNDVFVCPLSVVRFTVNSSRNAYVRLLCVNSTYNDIRNLGGKTRTVCNANCISAVLINRKWSVIHRLVSPVVVTELITNTKCNCSDIRLRITDVSQNNRLGLSYNIRILNRSFTFRLGCILLECFRSLFRCNSTGRNKFQGVCDITFSIYTVRNSEVICPFIRSGSSDLISVRSGYAYTVSVFTENVPTVICLTDKSRGKFISQDMNILAWCVTEIVACGNCNCIVTVRKIRITYGKLNSLCFYVSMSIVTVCADNRFGIKSASGIGYAYGNRLFLITNPVAFSKCRSYRDYRTDSIEYITVWGNVDLIACKVFCVHVDY